jgi:hypothetical protein
MRDLGLLFLLATVIPLLVCAIAASVIFLQLARRRILWTAPLYAIGAGWLSLVVGDFAAERAPYRGPGDFTPSFHAEWAASATWLAVSAALLLVLHLTKSKPQGA